MQLRWWRLAEVRWWCGSAVVVLLAWSIGQLLRDRSLWSGLLFCVPAPLAGLYGLLAVYRVRRVPGRRRFAHWLLLWSMLPVGVVGLVENRWWPAVTVATPELAPAARRLGAQSGPLSAGERTAETAGDMTNPVQRLVHWNIAWPEARWSRQREQLQQLDADLVMLSEITDAVQDSDFPGYQVVRRKNMLLAARGPLSVSGSLVPYGVLHAFLVRCELPAGRLQVLMADMSSSPRLPRDPYLRPLMQVAEQRQADLIVGDLNAPRRSLALSRQAGGFRHAYDLAGSGWSYTWPVPLPVLAIDQCLCGPRVTPLKYVLLSTTLSDHRLQVVDFVVDWTVPPAAAGRESAGAVPAWSSAGGH